MRLRRSAVSACTIAALAACGGGGGSTGAGMSASTGAGASTSTSTGTTTTGDVMPIDARPNDGSGLWPEFSNTGYAHTPANAGGLGLGAYPGHLSDHASGMSANEPLSVTYPDGSVIAFEHFLASKIIIYGDNLTFVGCLFEGTDPNDNLVQIYAATNVAFRYSTFKPSAYAMPPGNDGSVSSAHARPGTPFDQSWQLATTMMDVVAVMDHDDIWGNAGMEMVTGFPGRPSVWIASLGNTNGLALQGTGVYDHITFTNNYVSGWGYALSFGTQNNATNLTVTGNVFSAELRAVWGPLYGNLWGGTAHGSTWSNNLFQVRAGDDNTALTPSDHGKFWWPTDDASHAADYAN